MQSLSLCATKLDHACGDQLYERKHNPFVSYTDVQTNAARMANIVDYSQFATDLANNTVPDWPGSAPTSATICTAQQRPRRPMRLLERTSAHRDRRRFLRPRLTRSWRPACGTRTRSILVTWDESDFTGSGPSGFGDSSGC